MLPSLTVARPKAYVYVRSIFGIMVSNPTEGMCVRLVLVVCCLRCNDHSFKVGLPGGCVCLIVMYLETSTMRWPRPELSCFAIDILSYFQVFTSLRYIIIIQISNFYY
jgi:hypothetical protein